MDLPGDAYRGVLRGAGLIPQFVDAYIQVWDIMKAGYAAGISPAVEQMTGATFAPRGDQGAASPKKGVPEFFYRRSFRLFLALW